MNAEALIEFFTNAKNHKSMYIGSEEYPPIINVLKGMQYALAIMGVKKSTNYELIYTSMLQRYGLTYSALSPDIQLVHSGVQGDELINILLDIETYMLENGAYIFPQQELSSL